MKKTIFFITIFLLIFSLQCNQPGSSGGGGGSKNNPPAKELANGVFAKLYVLREISLNETIRTDKLKALFSKYYDPCAVDSDLLPTTVQCTDSITTTTYNLPFDNNRYEYNEPGNFIGFLSLGATYTFNVTASAEVPALTKSIDFPSMEPIINTPDNNESVSKSSDLLVTWQGITDYEVYIALVSIVDATKNITIVADDTGNYTIPAAQLSLLNTGLCVLQLGRYNKELINAPGYDDRSMIIAELIDSIFINLID